MRSLFTLAQRISAPLDGASIEQLAVDPENGTVFTAAASPAEDGLTTISIHAQFAQDTDPDDAPLSRIAQIETPAALRSQPVLYPRTKSSTTADEARRQVVSLHYLPDGGELSAYAPALCLVCAGGDIVFLPLPESVQELRGINGSDGVLRPEIVGSIEQGIAAAAWSPDDELLSIVTEETVGSDDSAASSPKVLLMTKVFDVLSERPIYTTDFGEDQPVDVGWGSRATQFHGSAGKAAAVAAAAEAEAAAKADAQTDPRGPATLDDDGTSRVCWRGDGAFFMVSAIEPFPSASALTSSHRGLGHHRIIRVFARDGNLSATSEPTVRGLTQVLSVKPTGNIIASSQRVGALDKAEIGLEMETSEDQLRLAKGREGRHDIVFFERNGLRHGEFSLREDGESQPEASYPDHSVSKLSWTRDHTIRDIAWNSDGSALAVLLARHQTDNAAEDVIQIWTMGNYHWYLKQEVDASALGLTPSQTRVSNFRWHPEAPHDLFVTWTTQTAGSQQHSSILEHRTFFLETVASSSTTPPHDAACVSVTDGAALFLTSFRLQNVPPPMSSLTLLPTQEAQARLDTVPVHVAWADAVSSSSTSATAKGSISILAVLYPRAVVCLYALCWGQMPRAAPQGARTFPTPIRLGSVDLTSEGLSTAYQIAASVQIRERGLSQGDEEALDVDLAVLGRDGARKVVGVRRIQVSLYKDRGSLSAQSSVRLCVIPQEQRRCRIVALQGSISRSVGDSFMVHSSDGSLLRMDTDQDDLTPIDVRIPVFCTYLTILSKSPLQAFGLSPNGHLYAIRESSTQLIARDATSFAVASSFLVWTNTAHQARFLPLHAVFRADDGASGSIQDDLDAAGTATGAANGASMAETMALGRSVERGSRIVVAVPSSMSLILQMPRGNLETVCPRPMVLEVVRAALDRRRYAMAFRICRTHRLDMNILHDHDPTAFLENLSLFIEQIKDVDYLNLFLTSLRDDDVTEDLYKPLIETEKRSGSLSKDGKVNRIATRIREDLQARDQRGYINSILTAFASMKPPAYEPALELLGQLREEDSNLADEAVRYVIFLADADKLFDIALGTYDFALVLMVAQHAKRKDPREYLPFLRELRAVEPIEYQRFRIDEYLGRRTKALKWLLASGPSHHEEAMEYVRKHKLHAEAIQMLSGQPKNLAEVQGLYAEYLEGRNKPQEAALAYMVSGSRRKAVECFRQAANWKDALGLAFDERLPASEVKSLAREAADDLEGKGRYFEAGRIYLEYERDVEQAVLLFCKANDLSEARRVCATAGRRDLLETTIKPGAFEAQERLLEELEEMREQMTKQVARLAELRSKKTENPAAFYMENDPALDNVDVMTDTSTQITQYTRYTSVPSLASMSTSSGMTGSTNKSRKTKRKEERKKNSGKKGSIYEEDYLFESLQKLLKEKLQGLQVEVARLLPHLAVLSNAHRNAGKTLRDAIARFESSAQGAADELWAAEVEQERGRAAELDQLVSAGPEAWMATYRRLNQSPLGRRVGARARVEVAATTWRCEALDVL
ncbi:hypothetical protein A4X06_0g1276 [Tilletia controversa]|uniref:Elongator complex protein 1 n=1 Tax=Tilletia controversa TaxID=13291 RepID=A0A8X7T0C0_9BASI|nr:hypothetical protein CF328_g317 [Tilletia controversa]KAE8253691.1 hypothetical protein A4X06_0g1276 [Tilletia controversa]CAD6977243.1 unnamed protein product [Tilletia controversa]